MKLLFCPTHKCNLDCKICGEKGRKPTDLKTVDAVFKKALECDDLDYVCFSGGGEPLQELGAVKRWFNLIEKDSVRRQERSIRPVTVSLVTNATAFAGMPERELRSFLRSVSHLDVTVSRERIEGKHGAELANALGRILTLTRDGRLYGLNIF